MPQDTPQTTSWVRHRRPFKHVLEGPHEHTERSCRPEDHEVAHFDGLHMSGWKPFRHRVENINPILAGWLSKMPEDYTPDQQVALESLNGQLTALPIPNKPIFNPQNLLAALDAIFFGGFLSKRCTLKLTNNRSLVCDGPGKITFTQDVVPVQEAHVTICVWDLARSARYWNRGFERRLTIARRLDILSVVIHQMCHAFLLVYGCNGKACATTEVLSRGLGFSGHGPAWKALMRDAEAFFILNIVTMEETDYEGDEENDPYGLENAAIDQITANLRARENRFRSINNEHALSVFVASKEQQLGKPLLLDEPLLLEKRVFSE